MNPFETDLDKNAANYVPLSPLGFLARSAAVYPKRLAVGAWRAAATNWAETYRPLPPPCRSASPCAASARATPSRSWPPTWPELFEAHFGVPMTGAVLNAINTRLDAETIAFIPITAAPRC